MSAAVVLTVGEVLEKGIQREIESQALYGRLGGLATDDAARDVFRQLVKEEKKHESLLRRYLEGKLGEGSLKRGHVLDYRIAEHLEQPEIKPEVKLDAALLLAANREKAAHEFYTGLAAAHPAGRVKSLLEELASQELGHKQKMEFMYAEVAYPQLDGG